MSTTQSAIGHRFLQFGVALFFLGLLSGFANLVAANPRMALTSHLEGVLNGMFLILLGLLWPKIRLGAKAQWVVFGLVLYGAYVNWGTTLLASLWGAGAPMMPLAGEGLEGTPVQEGLIAAGLLSLSVAMVIALPMILWGLRLPAAETAAEDYSATSTGLP